MKLSLAHFNAAGVLALVLLAVLQWRDASALRQRRDALAGRAEALEKKLAGTEAALASVSSTAEEFRRRIAALEADNARLGKALREAEARIGVLTADNGCQEAG